LLGSAFIVLRRPKPPPPHLESLPFSPRPLLMARPGLGVSPPAFPLFLSNVTSPPPPCTTANVRWVQFIFSPMLVRLHLPLAVPAYRAVLHVFRPNSILGVSPERVHLPRQIIRINRTPQSCTACRSLLYALLFGLQAQPFFFICTISPLLWRLFANHTSTYFRFRCELAVTCLVPIVCWHKVFSRAYPP